MLHCFVVASNSPKLGKVKLGALASAEITTASSEKKSNNTNVALPQANRHRQALSPLSLSPLAPSLCTPPELPGSP